MKLSPCHGQKDSSCVGHRFCCTFNCGSPDHYGQPSPEALQAIADSWHPGQSHLAVVLFHGYASHVASMVPWPAKPVAVKKPKKRQLTPEQKQEIRSLYGTGQYTQNYLARVFDVCQKTISDITSRAHVLRKPRSDGKLTPEQRQEIVSCYKLGICTQGYLAEAFQVSRPTISKILKKFSGE